MANRAKRCVEAVIERDVRAVRTATVPPGKHRLLVGRRRIKDPGVNRVAGVSSQEWRHGGSSVIMVDAIEGNAFDPLDRFDVWNCTGWGVERPSQQTGIGQRPDRTNRQCSGIQIYQRRREIGHAVDVVRIGCV